MDYDYSKEIVDKFNEMFPLNDPARERASLFLAFVVVKLLKRHGKEIGKYLYPI